jgi:hypothetical protein
MAEYPLTSEGVRQKQDELFRLEDRKLQDIAVQISKDFKTWIFENFKLTNEQRERFEDFPLKLNLIMGWQTSSGVINRDYVSFAQPKLEAAAQRRMNPVKVEGTAEVSYNESDGFSGSVGIKLSC